METKGIRVHETGGPEVMRLETLEVGRPGPREALVRHEAIGVNFIDTYHRNGLYPADLPLIPGVEAAGTVVEVGPDVTEVAPGDRVAYGGGDPGAYSEERVVPAARLVPLPAGVSARQAAGVTLRGITVAFLIRRVFRVEPGMTVLWHAAAGGVGLIACQWLSHLGVTVIGTAGGDDKTRLAREHGCAHAIDYRREDFVERVAEITGGAGVPVVYDAVGRSTFEGSLGCLSPRGLLVAFGNASGAPPPVAPLRLAAGGSLYLTRPRLGDYTGTRSDLLECADALFELVASGVIEPVIGQEWPLGEAAAAHEALEGRATTGSTIMLP